MKSGITPRSIAMAFLVVLGLYLGSFYGIEHLRHRKGPWEVAFQSDAQSNAAITISQSRLGISNVRLIFHGERATNGAALIRFDRVKRAPSFGQVIYEDLTFLPGVVTFDLFGHEIELVPRVLSVNRKAIPWQSGATIELWPTNKPATPPAPPKHR